MQENPNPQESRPVRAQETTPVPPVPTTSGEDGRPEVKKLGALTVIGEAVIPAKADSRPPGHFMSVSKALLRSKQLSRPQKLLLIVLHDMRGKNDRSWPSLGSLAFETGMAGSTVSKAREQLEADGFVVVDQGGGRKRSNRYYLTQLAFPCKLNPEVLCDRASCPVSCDWSQVSVLAAIEQADATKHTGSRGELPNENTPAAGEFQPETLREPGSIDPETPREPVRNQGTYNTEPRNRRGKEPSAASGGGPAPAPPSDVILQDPIPEVMDHQAFRSSFCQMYERAFGKSYVWQAQDGAILKDLLNTGSTLDQLKSAAEAMFNDKWAVKDCKASMRILSSKINQYLKPTPGQPGLKAPLATAGSQWDEMVIDVHTLPQPGEEPHPWPWPRKSSLRKDSDIPFGKANWRMSQFSSDIIQQAYQFLSTSDCSSITMCGPPGNGKTSVAAFILQAVRDHRYPEDDNQTQTVFVSFEEFKRRAVIENTNENTGWVYEPQINREFIASLMRKRLLVLDDVCNREMSTPHTDALAELLRIREHHGHVGYETIITTNRTMAELEQILGPSVVDRLAGGIILRFVEDSFRGKPGTAPLGIPAPEGEELARFATASVEAMRQYINYGPAAFANPRSWQKVHTAFDPYSSRNATVEAIAGKYWYQLSQQLDNHDMPLRMPDWEILFDAVNALVTRVGGLMEAEQYLYLLTSSRWRPAVEAAKEHARIRGKNVTRLEQLFLDKSVYAVMQLDDKALAAMASTAQAAATT